MVEFLFGLFQTILKWLVDKNFSQDLRNNFSRLVQLHKDDVVYSKWNLCLFCLLDKWRSNAIVLSLEALVLLALNILKNNFIDLGTYLLGLLAIIENWFFFFWVPPFLGEENFHMFWCKKGIVFNCFSKAIRFE